MNIHLPAILGFTRYQGFDPSPVHHWTWGWNCYIGDFNWGRQKTGAEMICWPNEGWQPWKLWRRSDPNISDWWWFQKAMCVHILYVLHIHNYIYTYYISLLYNIHYINFIGMMFFLSVPKITLLAWSHLPRCWDDDLIDWWISWGLYYLMT